MATTLTSEIWVVRRAAVTTSPLNPEWCAECGVGVGMLSVGGAAREAGVSELTIYRLVAERALHFREDAEGRVLVCLQSLRR